MVTDVYVTIFILAKECLAADYNTGYRKRTGSGNDIKLIKNKDY